MAHVTGYMDAANARLEIFHSTTAGGTYADIGGGPDIATGYNPRGGFVGATFTGVVRRYVGVRLNLASSDVLEDGYWETFVEPERLHADTGEAARQATYSMAARFFLHGQERVSWPPMPSSISTSRALILW